jgi:SM-20-related protein
MPPPDFFARLGLFVVKDFFDADGCASLRAEAAACEREPLAVVDGYSADERIKDDVRRTKGAQVSKQTRALVRSRLTGLQPDIERHFGLTFEGCEQPQFLVYQPGDYFRAHRDGEDAPGKPDYARRRRVSIVIFLNGETETPSPGSFCGGALTLYGLLEEPRMKQYGLGLVGEAGLLLGFRSDLMHEVRDVTYGQRYTVVSWFF